LKGDEQPTLEHEGARLLSAEERSLRAKLAAHAMHGRNDSRRVNAAARAKFLGQFEQEALDAAAANGEELTPEELAKRAAHLRKAHMLRLALASAKARRKATS
jgi:hypothetical protein